MCADMCAVICVDMCVDMGTDDQLVGVPFGIVCAGIDDDGDSRLHVDMYTDMGTCMLIEICMGICIGVRRHGWWLG